MPTFRSVDFAGDVQSPSPEQFARTELMIGRDALERLQNSCVLIAGLGAVGSYAVEALARSGVGRFRLVDFDVVQPSNINRQLFATWENAVSGRTARYVFCIEAE